MQSEKYRQLVDKLMTKTDRRELDWKEAAFPESFQVSFPNYSLLLRGKEIGFGALDVTLSIIDMLGSLVGTIDSLEIDVEERKGLYYLKMSDLYRAVRQQVLGADKAVEEILSELGE